jgi:hypothetical protein
MPAWIESKQISERLDAVAAEHLTSTGTNSGKKLDVGV